MKKNIDLMVVILNYNSTLASINAAESVVHNTSGNYMICIADNHSKTTELELLKKYKNDKVITLFFNSNMGYAKGNNSAITQLSEVYNFKYIVIMNPDITICNKYTINEMINYLEKENDERVIGVSPLVWNYRYTDDPRMQTSAMRIFFTSCRLLMSGIRGTESRTRSAPASKSCLHCFTDAWMSPTGTFVMLCIAILC